MLLGAATLALGSCCTSRVSNDIKKDTAIHGVEADMDAAYLTLSDAQRDIVTRNNDFGSASSRMCRAWTPAWSHR